MKRMNITMGTLTAAFLLCGIAGVPQDIPGAYLTEAAQNNPGLKSKFSEYLSALEKVPQVGSLPDPVLSFGYFIEPVETRVGPQRARISASQMFPWFGTLGARKDAATEMAKSKYEVFEEARSRLFYDVKSSYYDLYFIRKAIGITEDNLAILNTLHSVALTKVETGMASSVDVLRDEMEIADLQNQLALLNDNYKAMKAGFNNLLNVDPDREVTLPDSLEAPDIGFPRDAILDSIRSGNHQVLQADFMESYYSKQELAAKKSGAPNMALGLDYIIVGKGSGSMAAASDAGKDAVVFPMVGISIPIYRKKYTAMVKEAQLMQESTGDARQDKLNLLETAFEKADKEYWDAGRRIPLYRGQSDKATRTLNLLRTSYETGGRSFEFEQMLLVERQRLNYQLSLEKARADKDAATAFIQYLMGL